MFYVCKPTYERTGYKTTEIDRFSGRAAQVEWWRIDLSEHEDLPVQDMEEAISLYGGHPVLQWIGRK